MNGIRRGSIFIFMVIAALVSALALPGTVGLTGLAADGIFNQAGAPEVGTRYYVSKTGDGSDGLTWATAFTTVQDALAEAKLAGSGEIWVAAGVYYPDEGDGQTNNSVTSAFILANDISLYGGFKTGETNRSERDWVNNKTVLSGDITGMMTPTPTKWSSITVISTAITPITWFTGAA
jgi:hypothetical protein